VLGSPSMAMRVCLDEPVPGVAASGPRRVVKYSSNPEKVATRGDLTGKTNSKSTVDANDKRARLLLGAVVPNRATCSTAGLTRPRRTNHVGHRARKGNCETQKNHLVEMFRSRFCPPLMALSRQGRLVFQNKPVSPTRAVQCLDLVRQSLRGHTRSRGDSAGPKQGACLIAGTNKPNSVTVGLSDNTQRWAYRRFSNGRRRGKGHGAGSTSGQSLVRAPGRAFPRRAVKGSSGKTTPDVRVRQGSTTEVRTRSGGRPPRFRSIPTLMESKKGKTGCSNKPGALATAAREDLVQRQSL